MKNKLSKRLWLSFILIGLAGQLAWSIENIYLNVFLYNTIIQNTSYIASMVSLSAITATLTTFLMGILSDKVGKRKAFISFGYILWGLSTAAFGFVNNNLVKTATTAAALVVALDCLMTFFGSTANDAAFNAYVTDQSDESNRGKIEGVLSSLSLISMLIIFGLFDGFTQRGEWKTFFAIFGIINIATGILSLFLLKDDKSNITKESHVIKGVISLLAISEIKKNKTRYLDLINILLISTSLQVFLPYLIIYIQEYLGFKDYALMLAIVLTSASVISILAGRFADSFGKSKTAIIAIAVMFIGSILMYFFRSYALCTIAALLVMSGYLATVSCINANLRDTTPKNLTGSFQGIRMVFTVAIPMIIGPFIGNTLIKNSGITYTELGVIKDVPTPILFLAASFILIPLCILVCIRLKEEKNASSK